MTELAAVKAALKTQAVETPSWAYGNSGTRFKVFAQPGVPRTPQEKLDDAAKVHELTGAAPTAARSAPTSPSAPAADVLRTQAPVAVRGFADPRHRY